MSKFIHVRQVFVAIVVAFPLSGTAQEQPVANASFWSQPVTKITAEKLLPVKVQIVKLPTLTEGIGTIQVNGMAVPATFTPTGSVVAAEKSFTIPESGIANGARPYVDRTYTLTQVPEKLRGLTLLQTSNGYKGIVDVRFAVVLSIEGPAYCFVAVDARSEAIYTASGAPEWLEEFAPSEFRVSSNDTSISNQGGYKIYVKRVSGNRIALGPASVNPEGCSGYFAFFGREPEPEKPMMMGGMEPKATPSDAKP